MSIITLDDAKVFLQITGTDKDALITALIPKVEADYYFISNAQDRNKFILPESAPLVVAQMIGFNMSQTMVAGGAFQSESIGSYSYSRGDVGKHGYPDSITSRIPRYMGSKP